MDTLDLNNVTLIGFSMGGGEVIRYCSSFAGQRVSRIVLVASVLPFMLKTADNPDGIEQQVFDGFIEQIIDDRPAFLTEFGKQFFGETFVNHPVSQPYMDWAHGLTLKASAKATIDCIGSFSSTDFRKELANIDLPALVIHGDNDKIVPIEMSSDKTAKMINGAVYKIYEGGPHGLFYTHKDQLNQDIDEFLAAGSEKR
jgi:pimeloyl-ACP methyl ester carboxylesterase